MAWLPNLPAKRSDDSSYECWKVDHSHCQDRIVWLRTNFGTIYGIDADTNGVVWQATIVTTFESQGIVGIVPVMRETCWGVERDIIELYRTHFSTLYSSKKTSTVPDAKCVTINYLFHTAMNDLMVFKSTGGNLCRGLKLEQTRVRHFAVGGQATDTMFSSWFLCRTWRKGILPGSEIMEVDDKTAVATAAPARATANGAGVFMCVFEREWRFESFPSTNAKAQTRGLQDTKTFWRGIHR